ncbi:DegT/DnrJ/EryC1/StrS family aminotransferase [Roseivivax sp. GX 12232]|uniref:DegT/DnrJ/EryC1/StrS family aminotransferase n=1 Tax=Roseivivax sp. GX 12232 TaxID=2900547 RepID=UPI001E2D56E1|nr:DegT/DnrJ/EryC1/StrS family aminotransferase [Roseivivax sp. GX 12232]MCE0506574.1 DegT/DnrJ/EryC1/StrS family aminotransferase [Roseivivax sp. GX 12232]
MQFIDLAAQQARIRDRLDARIASVLDHGKYIMGPEVRELEEKLAAFCGAKHCIACANGTDALQLALMALGIRTGDAVFVPSFTFAATAEVVPCMGATPVFVDIDPTTYNMDPASLDRAIAHARELGLRPAVVVPVDLFGLPADYPALQAIANDEGLSLIGDSAQGFGGMINAQMTGTFADITTTSFFPAKPLGCYGDGGALFTDDAETAALLDSLRIHGKSTEKYDNVRIGMNSRLDTLQAAILIEKLAIYDDEIKARQRVAEAYTAALYDCFVTPHVPEGYRSIWAQYTLGAEDGAARDRIMNSLKAKKIPTVVYYPRPLHTQGAYVEFPRDPAGLPASEAAARRVFSIPMHPYQSVDDRSRVIAALTIES